MDRHYQVTITVPDGTADTAPQTTSVPLENATLIDVEIVVPPGHAGQTGIRIRQSAQQIIPWGNPGWIIADNYQRIFPVNAEIGSRSISVQAYNTDAFDHSFFVRFHIRDLGDTRDTNLPPGVGAIADVISSGDFTSDNPQINPEPVPLPLPSQPPPPPPPPLQ